MDRKEAATKIYKLKNERDELERAHKEALQKLASYERREQAEHVLARANEIEGAPEKLKTVTVDEFLAKRARLENREEGHLEKAAALVEFSGEGDDFVLSDMPSSNTDPMDLTGWIRSKSGH